MKRFVHPIHARGVQCSKIDGNVQGPLTDRKIQKYILKGYYGPERQQQEFDRQRSRNTNDHRKVLSATKKTKYDFSILLDGI